MRSRARALPVLLALVAFAITLSSASTTWAFPGVAVSVTGTRPTISTTELVVMQHADVSIVTLAVDYRGPFERFALLLPVPRDVVRGRLRTVKHEFIARLQQMTAPRVFEFWEQDPCVPGAPEQAWQEKVPVKNRGFLTPEVMPPRDAHYQVPNELSLPEKPVFKEAEDEFSYQLLRPKSSAELRAWLEKRGYRVDPTALDPLLGVLGAEAQLLVAEVLVDHAELIDSERLQLGGIRYWSRRPLLPIFRSLGQAYGAPLHDLFVYGLHRQKRYQAAKLSNVFVPTNLLVTAGVGAKVGPLYNTLFERLQRAQPAAAITEFVGPSDECGEPCSNAPLELRELLTFGGDVLEAETVSPSERTPPPTALPEAGPPAPADPLPPAAARARSKERLELERRLGQKRALLARQRYVLTRLHLRGTRAATPSDLELAASEAHQTGGYGVPRGPSAELDRTIRPANADRYQVRFHAAHAWQGALPCARPERWRWGKRWKSETQHWRGVDVARDLLRAGEYPKLLDALLLDAVPEIGFQPPVPTEPKAPEPEPEPESEPEACNLGRARPGGVGGACLLVAVVLARFGRRSVRVGTRAKPVR